MRSHLILLLAIVLASATTPLSSAAQQDAAPCCTIIEIDSRTGVVTVRDNKAGTIYQLRLARAEPRTVLRVGQAVSLDRVNNTLRVAVRGAEPVSVRLAEVKASARPTSAAPCCSVVAIDAENRVVTARETSSGYTFRFRAPAAALPNLKVGEKVWADFAAKTIRLRTNDAQPCCSIIN